MKIQIIGYSGSGKSTFAKRLAQHYNISVLHLDTIHFKEDWQINDIDVVIKGVEEILSFDNWIIEGNYSRILPRRFDECDMMFFLKFNRFKCLYGALKRYFKYRGKERDTIAKECLEKFDFEFFKWIMWEGRTKKRKKFYKDTLKRCQNIYIFRNRRQVNKYLLFLGMVNK